MALVDKKTILRGERIILRPLKKSDVADIYRYVNNAEIAKWTASIPHPYPKRGAEKVVRDTQRKWKRSKAFVFGIVPKGMDTVVGIISLERIDQINRHGELGYWLGKPHWGNGMMAEAGTLVMRFGFRTLKLHRIYASVLHENRASERVLTKLKFKKEGVMREKWFRFGRWHNVFNYAILDKEYKKS